MPKSQEEIEQEMLAEIEKATQKDVLPPGLDGLVFNETIEAKTETAPAPTQAEKDLQGLTSDSGPPTPRERNDDPFAKLPDPPRAVDPAASKKSGSSDTNDSETLPAVDSCPHCGWDLSAEDIPEPEYSVKMAFLQCVLGQRHFEHQYSMLGDKVVVRFRTLTIPEIDSIYAKAHTEAAAGKFQTILEQYEYINRYRLFLQLSYLAAPGGEFTYSLPDGLDLRTNKRARKTWADEPNLKIQLEEIQDKTEGSEALHPSQLLDAVATYVETEIFRSEVLHRAVYSLCSQFNRLVSKLEAMVDNSDFWKKTGARS